MRILIVNLSPIEAITSSMYRTLAIAHGLLEQGHKVDMLVTEMNTYNVEGTQPSFVKNIQVIKLDNNNLKENIKRKEQFWVIQKAIKIYHLLNIWECDMGVVKDVKIDNLPISNYDIVISSSDPKSSHMAVKKLIKEGLTYSKWIQYWGDPLTIDITARSLYPKFFVKHKEMSLLSGADKVVYVSPFTLREQKRMFKRLASKMFFFPVAYMEKVYYPKTHNEKFTVDYYGAYKSTVRDLRPFYNAAVNLKDIVHVHIVGDSDLKLERTDNIDILPRGIVNDLQEKADLLVCVLNKKGTQIPGKIYHAAGTNKKILCILDGEHIDELRDYLNSFKRFYICYNNVESIEYAIKSICQGTNEFEPLDDLSYTKISSQLIR